MHFFRKRVFKQCISMTILNIFWGRFIESRKFNLSEVLNLIDEMTIFFQRIEQLRLKTLQFTLKFRTNCFRPTQLVSSSNFVIHRPYIFETYGAHCDVDAAAVTESERCRLSPVHSTRQWSDSILRWKLSFFLRAFIFIQKIYPSYWRLTKT